MNGLKKWLPIAGLLLACGAFASPAHANIIDRVKEIYQAPERLQELQRQYDETRAQLERQLETQRELLEQQARNLEAQLQTSQELFEAQAEQLEAQIQSQRELLEAQAEHLEASRRQAEALLARQEELQRENETYRQQNEALLAENQQLVERVKKAEESRQSILRIAATAAGVLIGLIALYSAALRIWRYAVWRRQGRRGGERPDIGGKRYGDGREPYGSEHGGKRYGEERRDRQVGEPGGEVSLS